MCTALWDKVTLVLRVCVTGYLVNFVPYFFMERSLFLHHYLPSLIFQLVLAAAWFELLDEKYAIDGSPERQSSKQLLLYGLLGLGLAAIAYCFISLLPLSYGSGSLSALDVKKLKWRDSWHLIVHKT